MDPADNYAWWCTKKWFDDKWGNNPTKRMSNSLKRDAPDDKGPKDNGGINYYGTISSDKVKITTGSPKDCKSPVKCPKPGCDNTTPKCDYIGEEYSDYDSTSTAPPPPTPSAVAPYTEGICSLHMTYWRPSFYPDNVNPYEIEIRILDASQPTKKTIGWQPHTPATDKPPFSVNSRLEDPLVITPEEHDDYVRFTIGKQTWATNDNFADGSVPHCTIGDWDCSDPLCVSNRLDALFEIYVLTESTVS